MWLFGFLPIRKNRIFFMSYYGKHINCNPYAIYCWGKEQGKDFQAIWVSDSKMGDEITVKYRSLRFYYYLRTSAILIFNARPNVDIRKRRGQFYIQTWHSFLGFKMIEKDTRDTLDSKYVKKAKKDSKYIDLLLAGCGFRRKCFERNFWYQGKIAEFGTPRNDVLFSRNSQALARNVKKELGIPEDTKILLYAPTFRNADDLSYATSLDAHQLRDALTDKFPGDWAIVYRLHPNVKISRGFSEGIVDASSYKDMQMLLLAADVLVTDYSSVMFDFMLLNRPCFLYCPDFKEYTSKERRVYFTVDELPFGICEKSQDLYNIIRCFHEEDYHRGVDDFMQRIDSFEHGTACEQVWREIDLATNADSQPLQYEKRN